MLEIVTQFLSFFDIMKMSLVARKLAFGVSFSTDRNQTVQLYKTVDMESRDKHTMKNKGGDQTARICMLICAFIVRVGTRNVFSS